MIVYGNSKQREKLMHAYDLMYYGAHPKQLDRDGWHSRKLRHIKFIMISEQRKKYFIGHHNAVDVENFISKFYSQISRIYNYNMVMDMPWMLATNNPVFDTIANKRRAIPELVTKRFEKVFKFVYNPDNEYITIPNKGQVSVSNLNEYLIEWKNAHPMHEFVSRTWEKDSDSFKAIEHYINLINFNSKLKCYG